MIPRIEKLDAINNLYLVHIEKFQDDPLWAAFKLWDFVLELKKIKSYTHEWILSRHPLTAYDFNKKFKQFSMRFLSVNMLLVCC